MLLKSSPFILLAVAVIAIILRSVGAIDGLATSIILAIVILAGIAIGIYRSKNSRKAKSPR